ncbi:ribulose-phosphate 3-epimerase [Lactobacillus sp. ESL0731]|uniref:ribulose-phosphate 3-epimerase n=1 Tax=unclassified Lactobacillus TaxID=2620435 RepID=UPI0023F7C839|nr:MULTISPECIES: ribulose-phosphate 3-epimerase [unclassified Lactobacillus]WEV50478.1 ribulose-phosphate 3-epimerase [Lactobacillus sp. ESL0700]WEV61608.1 ribulose-phosphate 3-epimerase [Lactobacillus sp. ESL0731]
MLIAPSILNANNLNLKSDIAAAVAAGISRVHIDIMDGHFVPNLSFGPQLVSDFKRAFPDVTAEIHLMSDKPDIFVPAFVSAGADLIELHYEAMSEAELDKWLTYLNQHHVKAGLVLSPDTPVTVLPKFVAKLDQILLMTVYPGFGGQKFIPEMIDKINRANELLQGRLPIEVDGGIDAETAQIAQSAGASIFVAGSYLFGKGQIAKQVAELTEILR